MSKVALPESAVLAARDPRIVNSDEWPEFRVNDALVTLDPGSSEPVSLLLASEHHPLHLRGQLEAVSRDRAHLWLLSSKPRPTNIEVSEVRSHSYGAYQDGSVGLWAAGKAGWFLLVPSKKYRAVYDAMEDAVRIFYFITDAYTAPRKSGKGKSATTLPDYTPQELFEKYAIEVMGVEKGAPEAAAMMYKHREFLLATMMSEKEGMKWSMNPLYIHLTRKFPKDWRKVKQRLDGPNEGAVLKEQPKAPRPNAPRPKAQHERQTSLDSTSTTSSLKRKRGRPPKPPSIDGMDMASSSTSNSTIAVPDKAIPNTALTRKTQTSRSTRSNPRTSEVADSQATTPTAQESDYDSRQRRKSALRLKPNKPSKGLPKSGAAVEAAMDEDDDEDELSHHHPIPPRINGSKRKRAEESDARATWQRRQIKNGNSRVKRENPIEAVDEGIDIPTSPSSDADNSDAVAGAEPARNIEKDLHRSDQLQEDAWTCALDGCTHKVYGPASAPDTQRLIREHYALHAYDDDERVQMVKRMAEPSLPVSHLVDRVRGFVVGLKRMEGTKVAGSRFPESVKTKY